MDSGGMYGDRNQTMCNKNPKPCIFFNRNRKMSSRMIARSAVCSIKLVNMLNADMNIVETLTCFIFRVCIAHTIVSLTETHMIFQYVVLQIYM